MKIDKAAILIKKASLIFDKFANSVFEEYDLTASQYKTLKYITWDYENGVRISDLENFFSMSHPTVIGIVQNLEKKGLIEYRDNPNDARSRYIIPTEKALSMKEELSEAGDRLEAEMTKNLSEEERQQLIDLLMKMIDVKD